MSEKLQDIEEFSFLIPANIRELINTRYKNCPLVNIGFAIHRIPVIKGEVRQPDDQLIVEYAVSDFAPIALLKEIREIIERPFDTQTRLTVINQLLEKNKL